MPDQVAETMRDTQVLNRLFSHYQHFRGYGRHQRMVVASMERRFPSVLHQTNVLFKVIE